MYKKHSPRGESWEENEKDDQTEHACKFNFGVTCTLRDSHGRIIDRNCDTCGWNPDVAQERLAAFCKKYGIQLPK